MYKIKSQKSKRVLKQILAGFLSLLLVLQLFSIFPSPVYAAPGDLDPSFGVGGKVLFSINTISNPSRTLAVQSDGKLIIAGGTGYSFGLMRFNPDGSVDTAFGNGGSVITDITVSSDYINDVKIQQDGKIVAIGNAEIPSGNRNFALARYNANGSIDTSFGVGGKVTTNISTFPDGSNYAYALAIQNDGKIVVVGSTQTTTTTNTGIAVARYNIDGSLDTTFGGSGKIITSVGGNFDAANSVVIQSDGKIVAGGTALIRYNLDGSLDTTFSGDGKVESANIEDLVIQPDGKLVGVGSNFSTVRFNTDGSVDTTFGSGGGIDFGGVIIDANALVMQSNGKFVAGGRFQASANSENLFALARYNSNGSLDLSFGINGKIITPSFYSTANAYNSLNDLAIQTDGKLIAGGHVNNFDGTNPSGILVRYLGENQPPVANAGQDQTGNEGSSVTLNGSGSTDPDGDTLTYSWNFGDGFTGSGTIVTHTYRDNGVYTATLTVTDTAGASSSDTATITVNNVAPTVGEITAPLAPQQVNTTVSASANFTDPGVLDTHTAIWAWGDGSTSAGTVSEANGSGSVTGSHTYTVPGVYTLTLTVTDKDGASGTSVFRYIVIYDPIGGFVTGGGWIDSPAGAYTANPTLTGRANFGFNSKYQNGATVPTGQTQFNFKVANFNFHGNVYDWLVVSGPKAQYKGSGTVNGSGDYGFILTSNDGAVNGGSGVDKFRLKVWDKTTGNIVYDNQLGDNDDANASTALGAGNIIIHN